MKKDLTYNRNYGALTEISEGINEMFGDQSGRTVSLRTSHGFKRTFNLDISDAMAEDIVHAGMIFSAYNLMSENGNRTAGFLTLVGLVALYHNGKD
jgi:hypothetical protein